MGRRPLPSAARVRPGAHSARHQDSRNEFDAVSHDLAFRLRRRLRRRTPTKRSALRLLGGGALRSALTLPRFPALLRRFDRDYRGRKAL